MKSFKLIVGAIGLTIFLFALFFVLEFVKISRLKNEISQKKDRIEEARHAEKRIEKLQKDIDELEEASSYVDEMIPHDEQGILNMLEKITLLGTNNRFKGIEFNYADKQPVQGFVQESSQARAVAVRMKFEGEFVKIVSFLRDLMNLTTVISVDRVAIERGESILPRQQATITLTTYLY
ncbi:MAG: type 4a pilus biogenesis protein PilO [Candidatus Omnitrophica bacterium]|nr:type 4a pilus biogenesis protein PilO [Candidatus Omnitrophota bacterium]